MTQGLLFLAGTTVLLWISRRSLRRPSSHGFPRFFAFEATLVLVVLNGPHWFERPLALNQLASWLLLAGSLVWVVWAAALIHRRGQQAEPDPSSSDYRWEHTTRLVTAGIYRRVRHPMYGSVLLGAWGAVLKSVTPVTVALGVVVTAAILMTARLEEVENLERFGEAYRRYMLRTRRFVPFLF